MKTGRAIAIGLVLIWIVGGLMISGEISREPLDRLWEEHMLAGTAAIYSDGKQIEKKSQQPYQWAMGDPLQTATWGTLLTRLTY